MAEVDHDLCSQTRFVQTRLHFRNMCRAIVRLFAAAQNDMAVAISAGVNNGGVTPFGHGEEAVRRPGSIDGVDRHFDGAIGAVFKADRTGKP